MIRPAEKKDYSRIAEIYNAANIKYLEIYSKKEKESFDLTESEDSIAEIARTRKIFVFIEKQIIVGYITLYNKNKTTTWISSLYIDPNFQRNNYGQKLLNFAEIYAKNNNTIVVALETHKKAIWAINFYKKNKYIDIRKKIKEFPYSKILNKPPVANRPLLAKLII
jgi:ribosomal protein S18 acetylase RimI-like enzyme